MSLSKGSSPERAGPIEDSVGGSSLIFRLDPASGVPTYAQLVHQVEHALRLGYLQPGDQLPRVLDVVEELAINPNTVLKAYKELEGKGLAAGRPGQGTFVTGTLEQVDLAAIVTLRRSLWAWFDTAFLAGLDEDGIVALVTTALRDYGDTATREDETRVDGGRHAKEPNRSPRSA